MLRFSKKSKKDSLLAMLAMAFFLLLPINAYADLSSIDEDSNPVNKPASVQGEAGSGSEQASESAAEPVRTNVTIIQSNPSGSDKVAPVQFRPESMEFIGPLKDPQTQKRILEILDSDAPEYAEVKDILAKVAVYFNQWAEKKADQWNKKIAEHPLVEKINNNLVLQKTNDWFESKLKLDLNIGANGVLAITTAATSSAVVIISETIAYNTISNFDPTTYNYLASVGMVGFTFAFEGGVQSISDAYMNWVIDKNWSFRKLSGESGGLAKTMAKRMVLSLLFAGSLNAIALQSGTIDMNYLPLMGRTALEGFTYIATTQYYFELQKKSKLEAKISPAALQRNGQFTNFIVTSAANAALLSSKFPTEVFGHVYPEFIRESTGFDPNALTVFISASLLTRGAYLYHKELIQNKFKGFKNACKASFYVF